MGDSRTSTESGISIAQRGFMDSTADGTESRNLTLEGESNVKDSRNRQSKKQS
jgi:hypothetical protein